MSNPPPPKKKPTHKGGPGFWVSSFHQVARRKIPSTELLGPLQNLPSQPIDSLGEPRPSFLLKRVCGRDPSPIKRRPEIPVPSLTWMPPSGSMGGPIFPKGLSTPCARVRNEPTHARTHTHPHTHTNSHVPRAHLDAMEPQTCTKQPLGRLLIRRIHLEVTEVARHWPHDSEIRNPLPNQQGGLEFPGGFPFFLYNRCKSPKSIQTIT